MSGLGGPAQIPYRLLDGSDLQSSGPFCLHQPMQAVFLGVKDSRLGTLGSGLAGRSGE